MKVLFVSGNQETFPAAVVPIGVLAVAGAVRVAHEVEVIDLCFEDRPIEALRERVARWAPDVVAMGMRNLDTNAYDEAGQAGLTAYYQELVAAVRAVSRAPIGMGGAGFSLQPNRLLAALGADFGIVGEAERAMLDVLDALAAGRSPPRLTYGGTVIYEREAPVARQLRRSSELTSDLDLLPPIARDLVDPRHYQHDGTEPFQTKRGCAFACTYCDYPDLEGRKVRVRDPDRIADEIMARAQVPGVRFAYLVDSVFNVPPRHALAVCRALLDRGTPLPWACYGTPVAFDEELVQSMARAGCRGVEVGTDSGTERMLALLKKPFGLEAVKRTRAFCRDHGIVDSHTFVLGAEDETVDEVERTLAFVDQLDPDVAVFVVFTEQRESRRIARATHREAILELLRAVAPGRSGWIVPELGIRSSGAAKLDTPGPPWIEYGRARRRKAGPPAMTSPE
jgi:Radical SAM superfamily/B12 binding domain